MLSRFDDFPIHQSPLPLTRPATSDRNAYDRYWFGMTHRGGEFQIEGAFGRYPNLAVQDASISIARDGRQHSFHASRRAPLDPADQTVGPLRLEIVEPLRQLRIVVEPNDTGIACDLRWRSRTGALLEDHTIMQDGVHVIIDMARFVQFGSWEGTLEVDGNTTTLRHDEVAGIRDRSWGVRPVGAQAPGKPSSGPPNAWLWAPLHWRDACSVVGWFQRPGGEYIRPDGHRIAVVDPVPESVDLTDASVTRVEPIAQRLTFQPGTRWATAVEIDVEDDHGERRVLALAPQLRFDMRGLGYQNPDWSHGVWHGELEIGREDWAMAEISPSDPTHQHVHHIVNATLDGDTSDTGVGIFEQIIFGPHTQFGFHDLLDGAAG